MGAILRVQDICKIYQAKNSEVEALENISFEVQQGEFISIVGPSGCGKSTLLSIIAGLEPSTSGDVYINDKKISGVSDEIGYMLQSHNLLDWRTIWKNVTIGLEIKHMLTKENQQYVMDLLKLYEIDHTVKMYPNQLSGGMKQRAALIRTLAVKPKILLLDEAFSALDYQTRIAVTDYVYKRIKEHKITTLMVTHDIPESISMSDRVIVLEKQPGKVKTQFEISFPLTEDTPLARRNHPKFSDYFNQIWKELGIDE
jgi:NitT/TauT family transport system ATP-binding protein